MAANLLKEVFHADGVIVTKGVGGASTLCVGAIASEAEKLGIKAVPVIQILNGKSNLGIECMISEKMWIPLSAQVPITITLLSRRWKLCWEGLRMLFISVVTTA